MSGLAALLVAVFVSGVGVGHYRWWPFDSLQRAHADVREWLAPGRYLDAKDWFDDMSGKSVVPCPADALVVVGFGQSNAANTIPNQTLPDPARPVFGAFDGRCYVIADPLPGTDNRLGSLWPRFGEKLAAALGRPVVIVPAAASNSSVLHWISPRYRFVDRLEHQLTRLAETTGLEPAVFIWIQGESDAAMPSRTPAAQGKPDAAAYTAALDQLFTRLAARRARKPPAFVVTLTSLCWALPDGSPEIRKGQADLVARRRDTHMGGSTDAFGASFRYDGCHLNRRGADSVADMLAAHVAPILDHW